MAGEEAGNYSKKVLPLSMWSLNNLFFFFFCGQKNKIKNEKIQIALIKAGQIHKTQINVIINVIIQCNVL